MLPRKTFVVVLPLQNFCQKCLTQINHGNSKFYKTGLNLKKKKINIIKDKEEAGELFQIKDMWRDMTNKCNA